MNKVCVHCNTELEDKKVGTDVKVACCACGMEIEIDSEITSKKETLEDLVSACYGNSLSKGFHEKQRSVGDEMMLMVTELAESYEEHRNGHPHNVIYFKKDAQGFDKPEGVPVEYADLFIRLMDTVGDRGIEKEFFQAVALKMAYNATRPYKHGGKRV